MTRMKHQELLREPAGSEHEALCQWWVRRQAEQTSHSSLCLEQVSIVAKMASTEQHEDETSVVAKTVRKA